MSPSDASEQTIFETARQIANAPERGAYLDKACAGDPKLRERIEALLQASVRADEFLASDPLQLGERRRELAAAALPSEGPGTVIGKYKLLEKLGEGGCGVVYLAEQEEPVRRKVALKVIKLGMDTRQVVARFEAERQALALMDHPNIARVLEAGATETGRPYFVMELVGGIRITDYCDQNHFDTRQRLDLFVQVCRAIQHAHQKGIIHRDIKPSNVLVATQDGMPVPKVIDFGIAKATQGRLTDDTLFTAFEQFLGTPAYMSPEQAQLGALDVDTRSDIYSLGVLLYELLTGKTPFDAKELLAAGLEAMRRTIQEKEPPTPSTRLSQELTSTKSERSKTGRREKQKAEADRLLETRELVKLLRGDLDWIVMKCLEKDRARRYETANGLARDIERHLNNEPVVASPPAAVYRLGKFVRRNKAAVAAGGIIAAVLVLGVVISAWEARQQNLLRQQAQAAQANEASERKKAQTEATKSEQVARFLQSMLQSVGPSVAQGRDSSMLRELLEQTVQRVGKELTNQPEVQIELLHTITLAYAELGLYEQMGQTANEALKLSREQLGERNLTTSKQLELLAEAQWEIGHRDEAENAMRRVLATRRELLGNEHSEVSEALNSLALMLDDRGKYAEAEKMLVEALAVARKTLGEEHPSVADTLANLGLALRHQGKLTQAEAKYRDALTMDLKLLGTNHPSLGASLNSLGSVLAEEGKLPEAEELFQRVVALRTRMLGNRHPHTVVSLCNLAFTLAQEDKLTQAESIYGQAIEALRESPGKEQRLAAALNGVAFVYDRQAKLGEAVAALREALTIQVANLGAEHPDAEATFENLAGLLVKGGKAGEAETLCRERIPALRTRVPADDPGLADALVQFAIVLIKEGKFTEAEEAAREALTGREKKLPDDWRTFHARRILGASLSGQKRYAEAEMFLVSGYEGLNQRQAEIPIYNRHFLRETLVSLATLYDATGQTNQASQWKEKLEEFERAQTNRVAPAKTPLGTDTSASPKP